MRGLGDFQRGQMKQIDPLVPEYPRVKDAIAIRAGAIAARQIRNRLTNDRSVAFFNIVGARQAGRDRGPPRRVLKAVGSHRTRGRSYGGV
jgi:hypothetical protein